MGLRRSSVPPRIEAVAALHEISTDPAALGVALGRAPATIDIGRHASYQPLAELYRAAGADEQVAAAGLAWQKTQYWRALDVGGSVVIHP
jgi:hypothetical protein